jgi:Domain of unknown function (DUF4211)
VPLQVTRRKISGLRDSLVASSVWRPEFRVPLETYPEFDLIPLDFAVPTCDACHLGGRMSTLTGRLSGLPYDKLGFEIMVCPIPQFHSHRTPYFPLRRSRILTAMTLTTTILIVYHLEHQQPSNSTSDDSVVGELGFTTNLHTGRFVASCALYGAFVDFWKLVLAFQMYPARSR